MLGGGNLRGFGGEGGRVCAEREKRFWFGWMENAAASFDLTTKSDSKSSSPDEKNIFFFYVYGTSINYKN